MRFDILTLFPEIFESTLNHGLLKKALDKGIVAVNLYNIRDHAFDRHRVTDDTPFGGGGGMVMKVEPIARAIEAAAPDRGKALVILLSPQGETFCQETAEELARHEQLVLVCGRYEGVDERVREHLIDREISAGDFVLSGGEFAALVVVDAVSRLVPGFVGNTESVIYDSFSTGLLEGPQYTRPREFRGWEVPAVLLSGHQKNIDKWRRKEALRRTLARRPDLLASAGLSKEDREMLEELTGEPNREDGTS
ncbi:MAG: tRNA (guanosine(37)-N1)-methyltransferase TrmD [Deltaproteobacteria bacterium]|nr:tRNA (guanosine(37)-N1)-methyltransferase TrmD [Deltaproteobacteria bacterium]